MALPAHLLGTMSAAEIAFQAQDELITIVPRQQVAPLQLAGWKTPALRPMRPVQVPLWLALLFKKQGICGIQFPDWLSEHHLKSLADKERKERTFAELPWNWQTVSHELLAAAPEDLPGSVEAVRQLLQDLREIRSAKVRQGLQLVNESHMQMDGLGHMELNEIRPILSETMTTLQKIRR